MKHFGFIALMLLALAPRAHAEGIYLTEAQLAQKLFPEAPQTHAGSLTLTDAELAQVSQRFGYRVEQRTYRALTVSNDTEIRGTLFILEVMGQNSPITFGVGVTKEGIIRGVEVMAYREPRGEEIRSPRFLRQLTGKSLHDRVALGVDVDAVSGATISSRSATFAARKALALASVLLARPAPQTLAKR
ncbi:MAG: FMN-binding protein [Deltaproteobacteria bacterium]|nr:FMN-binding protein [Deltaproteobacteria bacterium]